MLGTLVNTGAIVAGSLAGMLIQSRLPEKMTSILFQGVGLMTLTIGISMATQSQHLIVAVLSVVFGAILAMDRHRPPPPKPDRTMATPQRQTVQPRNHREDGVACRTTHRSIHRGVRDGIHALLHRSMAILGSIEDGSGATPQLLLSKSIMDAVASIALGASFVSRSCFRPFRF